MKAFYPNEVEDLPKGDDWFVKYLTKEITEGHSLINLNYKIKDFELLDKDITIKSCVECLQFLQLLLQSNGDTHSIQKVLNNYKEKHQSNHLFSFIYSIILYNLNRKQEAHDILKQLTLLVKENKALQPTTLPITTWFLKKDIDSLKLACEEGIKEHFNVMQISPISTTLTLLGSGYELSEDFENLFKILFTILEDTPLLYTEDRLYQALKTFYQSSLQLSDKDYVSICLRFIFSRYAACFPSNVGIQYLFLEVQEKMGLMKDK